MQTPLRPNLVQQAFDPDFFRHVGHQLIDQLADYFQAAQKGQTMAVMPWEKPDERTNHFQTLLEAAPDENAQDFFAYLIAQNIHTLHPHYLGHQVASPAPLNALADLLASAMNSGTGVYEMGSPMVAIERVLIKNLNRVLGYGPQADGFMTNGGTLGNLTALLTARQARQAREGLSSLPKPALMVSEAAHYCVDRASKVMGWGEAGLIKIPVDAQYQMRADLLPAYYEQALKEGKTIVAVVANACSTATGAYDNIEVIADFCEMHQIWLHVDGAHGAAVIFSDKYKKKVEGIHRADSVVIDFHKMLLTSALTTALLYKNGDDSYLTFSQQASYLWADDEEREWYNLGKRTFECTKSTLGLKAYLLWRTYGPDLFAQHIDYLYDLGHYFAEMIAQSDDFALPVAPQSNIICFRYCPTEVPKEELNALNSFMRETLITSGAFYIVQTQLAGQLYLRLTLISPFTTVATLEDLLQNLRALGQQYLLENRLLPH
ncbi:MAG: pyridoxal-dependent decarboxylase [Microscillaceae bacterium]|nr:pyridoxal-dependent decarboxylase [Microscillaceae bacterium]